LLEELLHIGTEGLFLVSGKKGVGKTTQVNQAIKQMKEKEERG
jgi:type II secretory ATPase GspE/PulE/Tfp pilus assembly ATPase PilB-like protein